MGKLRKFCIDFEDGAGSKPAVFSAGQTINGNVMLELRRSMEIRRIYVTLKGEAEVLWTESRGDENPDDVFQRTEVYLNTLIVVAGSEKEKMKLPDGALKFSFSYTLPLDLPSSFAGDIGRVVYKAEATIEKPWAFNDQTSRHFTVHGILDLNETRFNVLTSPTTSFASEDAYGRPRVSVYAKVTLSKRCCLPNETIFLSAEVYNNSNKMVDTMCASLEQVISYDAQKTTKGLFSRRYKQKTSRHTESILTTKRWAFICPGTMGTWSDVPIEIPDLPPTGLAADCSIINVSYSIKFYVSSGLRLSIPVVIGTIPPKDPMLFTYSSHQTYQALGVPVPPSYAEAINMNAL